MISEGSYTTNDDEGGRLTIHADDYGDLWVEVVGEEGRSAMCRFRCPASGGGDYPKVVELLEKLALIIGKVKP